MSVLKQVWNLLFPKVQANFLAGGVFGAALLGGAADVGVGAGLSSLVATDVGAGLGVGAGIDLGAGVAPFAIGADAAGGLLGGSNGIGSLLQGLMGNGGAGLQSLLGGLGSAGSMGGIPQISPQLAGQAADRADPFGPQRAQFADQLPQQLGTMRGVANGSFLGAGSASVNPGLTASTGMAGVNPGLTNNAGTARVNSQFAGAAGQAHMNPVLSAIQQNDPSMQFRYQQGLDAVGRGAAAGGFSSSGAQMLELEKFGQGFASTEFASMFQRQMQLQGVQDQIQNQNFNQLGALQTAQQGVQQQNFGQQATLQQLQSGVQQQNFGQQATLQQLQSGVQQQNFVQNQSAQNQQFNQENQIAQLLAQLSGATTGSPGTAGQILAHTNTANAGIAQTNLDQRGTSIAGIANAVPGLVGAFA